jgi:hypothetical protein
MWTGWVTLGMYRLRCCPVAVARCSRARLRRPISVASPCTSTTCLGCSSSMNSLVCGKSACAEKLIASTLILSGTCNRSYKSDSTGMCGEAGLHSSSSSAGPALRLKIMTRLRCAEKLDGVRAQPQQHMHARGSNMTCHGSRDDHVSGNLVRLIKVGERVSLIRGGS